MRAHAPAFQNSSVHLRVGEMRDLCEALVSSFYGGGDQIKIVPNFPLTFLYSASKLISDLLFMS
jgi:hypothetical protein